LTFRLRPGGSIFRWKKGSLYKWNLQGIEVKAENMDGCAAGAVVDADIEGEHPGVLLNCRLLLEAVHAFGPGQARLLAGEDTLPVLIKPCDRDLTFVQMPMFKQS
jgi:hypothetical protein